MMNEQEMGVLVLNLVRTKAFQDLYVRKFSSHIESSSYLREAAEPLWEAVKNDRLNKIDESASFMVMCARVADSFWPEHYKIEKTTDTSIQTVSSKFIDEIQPYDRFSNHREFMFSNHREFMEEIFRWHHDYGHIAIQMLLRHPNGRDGYHRDLFRCLNFMANAAFSIAIASR